MNFYTKVTLWVIALIASITFADSGLLGLTGGFKLIYFTPFMLVSYLLYDRNQYERKSFFNDPKYLKYVQTLLSLLNMLILTGVKIPLISQIIDSLGIFTSNWSELDRVVDFIIAFVMQIYVVWAKPSTPVIGYIVKSLGGQGSVTTIVEPEEIKH